MALQKKKFETTRRPARFTGLHLKGYQRQKKHRESKRKDSGDSMKQPRAVPGRNSFFAAAIFHPERKAAQFVKSEIKSTAVNAVASTAGLYSR